MAIQFICGRSHSGKTQYILDLAKELFDSSKPFIIVVPEQFTHIAEKRLISKLGFIGLGIGEVLSFDRICKRINSQYPSSKRHLSAMGKSLIVSQILANTDLKYYKSSATRDGFVDVCCEEISEMKKYMVSPDALDEACEKIDNKALSLKLSDIATVYRLYESQLQSVFSDADDSLAILSENLEVHKPYEGYTFLFDEFSSFNPRERDVIAAIASQAENVYLSFCADFSGEYSSLFKPIRECMDSVRKVCEQRGCKVMEPIDLPDGTYACPELEYLEKNLYSSKMVSTQMPCNNIRIYTCENPYSEVANVASQISSLVRLRGVRYRDISVVCSDISAYGFIFRSVFDAYNIPYFIDEKVKILDHAMVSYVINILDVYLSGYSGETVVNYLKSGFISAEREAVFCVDNFIGATRASKNTWLSDEKFDKCHTAYCDGDPEKMKHISLIRNEFILPLAKLHDSIKGKNTVRYITEKLYDFLIKTKFEKRISEYISLFKKENNAYLAKQYENVWKTLIEAFDTLVYILGDTSVNLSQYRHYLHTALSQQKTGIIPTSLDEIVVGDVMRSKSEYADYQFVVGAVDGAFPGGAVAQSVISDAEKNVLSSLGVELSPDTSEKAYFDRFQIYSVLTHPNKGLIISYPATDSGFSSVRPSFSVTLIKNLFSSMKVMGNVAGDAGSRIYSSETALEHLAKSAAAICRGDEADSTWKDVYKFYSDTGHSDALESIDKCIESVKPFDKLDPALVGKLYGDEFYSTVSRIQRYNACRYSYFLEYMLRLKEKKTFGLESVDIGSLIHSIIEEIFESMKKDNRPLESTNKAFYDKEVEKRLSSYIDTMREFGGEVSERDVFSVKRLKDSIVVSLLAVKEHIVGSAFEPLGNEIVFDENNIGCIELSLANGKKVKITGKIDRADSFTNEDGTFIRVIDYKTGNKTFNFTDVFYGLDVQLLVYMNALTEKMNASHPAGALFFKIQNPIASVPTRPSDEEIKALVSSLTRMDGVVSADSKVLAAFSPESIKTGNKLSTAQFRILGDYINSIIAESAKDISEGVITLNPYVHSSASPCNFCAYGSVCNFKDGHNGTQRSLSTVRKTSVFNDMTEALGKKEGADQ